MNYTLSKYKITIKDCLDKKLKEHTVTGFTHEEAILKVSSEYDGNESRENQSLNYKYPLTFVVEEMTFTAE